MAEAAPGFGAGTDRPAIGAESRASMSFGCAAGVERLRQREAGAFFAPFCSNRLRPDRAHPLVGHLKLAQSQVRSRLMYFEPPFLPLPHTMLARQLRDGRLPWLRAEVQLPPAGGVTSVTYNIYNYF